METSKKDDPISRRSFGGRLFSGLAISALSLRWARSAAVDSAVKGVRLGAITGSIGPFAAMPGKDTIDLTIEHCIDSGVGFVELGNGFLEPRVQGGAVGGQAPIQVTPEYEKSRQALREWRLTTPASHFQEIRKRFDDGGVNLFSISETFADDCTDDEIDAMFRQMQALNLSLFQTNQTRVSMGPRMAPYAEKYGIMPGWHTHQLVNDPNEVSSPESLARVLAMSKAFKICLDIGHFSDGGNDPFKYFTEHHDQISHLHIKDAKSIGGPSVELGDGALRVDEMLRIVRDRRYPIAFVLERTYTTPGLSPVEETRKQIEWMKKVLES